MTAATNRYLLPPEWLAHRYDPQHDAFHFLNVPRDVRRRVPFLTDDNLTGFGDPVVAKRSDVLPIAGARLNFVFHSAYCCSTLVANCYDRAGRCYPLKEPTLLNDIVGWRLRGGDPKAIGTVLSDGLAQLARPYAPGEIGIIKPSNLINGLAPAMMQLRPEAKVLLLFAPLDHYLASIAGKGLWGRLWVRELLSKQLAEGYVPFDFTPQQYFEQSDLQVAAVGWLAQHHHFARMAAQWPDRVRTLNSEVLVAEPERALAALDALFGIGDSDAARAEVVATVFSRHAKFDDAFTPESRKDNQRSNAAIHADEVGTVMEWAREVATRNGVAMELPGALI